MELPATQIIDEEEFTPTQQFKSDANNENTLVAMLFIKSKQHFIFSGVTTIGRHPDCTIVINHETVSKKHAEIEAETVDGPLFIKDLNSCNITKINNTKLRQNSSYQIRDGDKLTFGRVVATFQLYHTSDNSFIISTPQVNKKIISLIPKTLSSEIDVSSTSESDISAIPGTQTDKIDTSFQSPKTSTITNKRTSLKLPALNLNNLSYFVSQNKNNQDNISEIETQRFFISRVKKDFSNSIHTTENKKVKSINKYHDLDENIYETETQKPFNIDDDKNDIKNLEIHQFNYIKKLNDDKKKSNNLTIYNANISKKDSQILRNESATDSEIDKFNYKELNSDEEKSQNISIYSAETQKITFDILSDKSSTDLEMQFNYKVADYYKKKLEDISIDNTETQKIVSETSLNTIKTFKKQKLNFKTFESIKEKSNNEYQQSIYTAETQKIESEELIGESIENIETQKFHTIKSNNFQTLNLSNTKSNYKILEQIPDIIVDVCLQDVKVSAEEKNDFNNSNSMQNESDKIFNLQDINPLSNSSFYNIKKSIKMNNLNETNDLKFKKYTYSKNDSCSSTLEEFDRLSNISNTEQMENVLNDKDEEEMYYSQNLIQDCPFVFFPEESQIDNQSNSIQTEIAKIKECKNKHSVNNLFISSTNINSKSIDKNKKNIIKENQSTIVMGDHFLTDNHVLLNQTYKTNDYKKLDLRNCEKNLETDRNAFLGESEIKIFYKNNDNNGRKIINKDIESNSETDEECMFSNYLFQEIDKCSTIDNVQNKSDINKDKLIKICKNNKNEGGSKSFEIPTLFKQNNVVFESSITNSDDSMFDDCDSKNKYFNQETENSLHKNLFSNPMLVIANKTSPSIKAIENFNDIKLTSIQKEMNTLKYNKLLSSERIDKQINDTNVKLCRNLNYKTVSDETTDKDEQKLLNSSKEQLTDLETNCNKISKKNNDFKSEKMNLNASIDKNFNGAFEGHDQNSIKKNLILLTQQLTNIVESNEIKGSQNTNLKTPVSSPTLSIRKNRIKVKKNYKAIPLEKSYPISQKKKSIMNLNNTIEEYKSGSIFTQQLKSVLQSQNDSLSNKDETIFKKETLDLYKNSRKKHRLNLSNLSTSTNPDEQGKTTQPCFQINSNLEKEKITLQESNLKEESQNTEIYFANLKSNRKHNLIEDSQCENKSKKFQISDDNVTKIVKKQNYANLSSIHKVINIEENTSLLEFKNTFTNDKESSDMNIHSKISMATSKIDVKKRLSLTLSKTVNLNLSQISMNNEEEEKFSMEEQNYKPFISKIDVINESNNSMSKQLKCEDTENSLNKLNQDPQSDPEQPQSSFIKVCKPYNMNLTSNETANVDCSTSDDDFLRSMPEIKVAGTADCPATNSQLAAPSDEDFDDENLTSVAISPLNIVIPTKWNWYAKKRYDLIYRKNPPDLKIENSNNIYSNSPSVVTQFSEINDIISKIESVNEQHIFKKTTHYTANNSDTILRSTRSRYPRKTRLIKSFSTTVDCDYDFNSDLDSDSVLEDIIPKHEFRESIKLDIVPYLNDESDEEFERLRKRCERMLAVPSAYKNICFDKNNSKQIKIRSLNTKVSSSKKSSYDSMKVMWDYDNKDKNDNSDNQTNNKKKNNNFKAIAIDKDALVFYISNETPKDNNTMLQMPDLVSLRNKRCSKTEVDNNGYNYKSIKSTKNNNAKNIQEPFKLQEVSVFISPLKKNVLSRFIAENPTTFDDNKKTNFKQSIDTCTMRQLSKSPTTLTDFNVTKRSRNKIENEDKSTKVQNRTTLRNKRAKLEITPEYSSNNLSKENLFIDYADVINTSRKLIGTNRFQKEKTMNSFVSEKVITKNKVTNNYIENDNMKTERSRNNRQNKNKNTPFEKITKLKRKVIIAQELNLDKSENIDQEFINDCVNDNQNFKNCKEIKVTIGKTRNTQNNNIERLQLEKVKIYNKHGTRSAQPQIMKDSYSSKIESKKKNVQVKHKLSKEIKNLDFNKIEMATKSRTRSGRIKNINDSNKKKSQITVHKEIGKKIQSNKICYQLFNSTFSESNDNGKEKNVSAEYTNINSRSLRIRKQIINSSKKFQEVADSKSSLHKEIANNNETNSESSRSHSAKLFVRPISKIKQARLKKSVKHQLTPKYEILKKDSSHKTSTKYTVPYQSIQGLPSLLKSLRNRSITSLIKPSYKILLTGNKSKAYSETVTKLGGTVIEDPAKCSILVTDKIRRTFKFLCSVARGIPIVSLNWLNDSDKVHNFLNWENYILKDPKSEAEFKFKLIESLKKTKNQKLFEGYTIFLTRHIVQPPISELKEMIIQSGGKCLVRAPRKWPEKSIIITQKDDVQSANKFIVKAPISVTIHSTEFILTGILRQEINLKEFKLSR